MADIRWPEIEGPHEVDDSIIAAFQTLSSWLSEFELPDSIREGLTKDFDNGDFVGVIVEATLTTPAILQKQPSQTQCRGLAAALAWYDDNALHMVLANLSPSLSSNHAA